MEQRIDNRDACRNCNGVGDIEYIDHINVGYDGIPELRPCPKCDGTGMHSPWFVTPYLVDQRYGGPEEGGWWYDWYYVDGHSLAFETRAEADAYALKISDEMKARNKELKMAGYRKDATLPDGPEANRPEGYIPTGWSSHSEVRIVIEREFQSRLKDNHTPRYE